MKKTTVLLLMAGLSVMFFGCKKTETTTVAPITLYQKIAGTWGVTTPQGATAASVKEVDDIAVSNNATVTSMDLTSQLNFASFTITFNVDGQNNATTFSVGGTAPQLIPASGYWELDYPYPSTISIANKIYLYEDAAKTNLLATLSIQSLPGNAPQLLSFKLTHSIEGSPYVSYVYSLYLQTSKK